MARIFQIKRGEKANLPSLRPGEMAYTTDGKQTFIGSAEGNLLIANELKKDIDVYVSTVGNDDTGNGTQSAPYATITKALSTIPKNLGGFTVRIYVSSGTYTEPSVLVGDFANGVLTILAADSNSQPEVVNGISVTRCSAIVLLQFLKTRCNETHCGIEANYSEKVQIENCTVNNEGITRGTAIKASLMSKVYAIHCASNNANIALQAENSEVYCYQMSGNGNNYGFHATIGAKIGVNDSTLENTVVEFFTGSGGRIYEGAQFNVLSH